MPEMMKVPPELIAMRGAPPCGRWPGNPVTRRDITEASGHERYRSRRVYRVKAAEQVMR